MARIVFMGTPEFAAPSLAALVQAGHDVVGVYTQPDRPAGRGRALTPSPIASAAAALGLTVFHPERLRAAAVREMAGLTPEVIVVEAYGLILPQRALDVPTRGAINVHPSLLPRHRGAAPIAGAILAGDLETGVTIMLMDAGLDTGPILSQERTPIAPKETTGALTERLASMSAGLLVRTIERWLAGEIAPYPQDPERATVTRTIVKEAGQLDWTLSAATLARQVRAYQPWPGTATRWKGQSLKILEAVIVAEAEMGGAATPGQVVALQVKGGPPAGVQTGDGVLGLVRVQAEGRRAVGIEEFLRGARDFVGAHLGE